MTFNVSGSDNISKISKDLPEGKMTFNVSGTDDITQISKELNISIDAAKQLKDLLRKKNVC